MALELDERQRAMLQEMGVHVWLPGAVSAGGAKTPQPVRAAPPAPVRAPLTPAAAAPASLTPSQNAVVADVTSLDWSAVQQAASACQACTLCAGRSHTTLQPPTEAQGWSGRAHWMLVGDQPDEEEDAAGRAFADAGGALLNNMLKALALVRVNDGPGGVNRSPVAPRHAAYVTNVVKCRAPHGAQPQAADLAQCAAFLLREIALVQPKVILAMGRFANQLLLSETPELAGLPLGKLRGRVYRYRGIAVVVTYHPKFLMRNSADKAKAWADLCLAADTLDALAA